MVLDINIGIIIQWGNEIQEVGPLPVPQKYTQDVCIAGGNSKDNYLGHL